MIVFSRRTIALFAVAIATVVAVGNSPAQHAPNVILILADDLAIGDLCDGEGRRPRTPSLDRLAAESVRFSQAYSASCVCAPARAALLTGRYPHRTGVVTLNMNDYPELTRIRSGEITIADRLRDAGYATGLVGKWHCGRGDGYHPLDRGFDEFEGFDGSEDIGYFSYRFIEQRQVVKFTDRYLTDDLSDRAIQFLRRHQEESFFLHLAHYAPHRPLEAPAEIVQRYRDHGIDEATATIYAMIEVMDRGIGELLNEIDRLGLSENTIVLFASDNGPDPLTGDRANQGLRGAKYQVYEGGIRVPLFIRWESQLSPGERTQTVSFVDLMPTILQLCGIEHGITPRMDGKSFVDVLRDANAVFAPPRFWQWNRVTPNYSQNAAMREGRFKLVRPFVTRGKNVADSKLPSVLFDLQSDPTESTDVSARFPKRAERMDQALQRWADLVERDRVRAKDLGAGR